MRGIRICRVAAVYLETENTNISEVRDLENVHSVKIYGPTNAKKTLRKSFKF